MRQFIGVIFENLDHGYVATFPDLPECVAFGETAEAASTLAIASFRSVLQAVEACNGEPIIASTTAEIFADPQNEGCLTFEAVSIAFTPKHAPLSAARA